MILSERLLPMTTGFISSAADMLCISRNGRGHNIAHHDHLTTGITSRRKRPGGTLDGNREGTAVSDSAVVVEKEGLKRAAEVPWCAWGEITGCRWRWVYADLRKPVKHAPIRTALKDLIEVSFTIGSARSQIVIYEPNSVHFASFVYRLACHDNN